MVQCKSLGLSNNGITDIEDGAFQDMIQLQSMWLDQNKLTSLPSKNPGSIKWMRLNNNQITEIKSENFAGMWGCKELYLYENEITHIEDGSFSDMHVLEYLTLRRNNLTSVPRDLPTTLQLLTLQSNFLTQVRDRDFAGLRVCRWLYLQDNEISDIENEAFRDLVSLERLKLNDNRLTTLQTGLFDDLAQLNELWIYNNPMTTLDPTLFSTQNEYLILLMSDWDSQDSWMCQTLCWLKHKEDAGEISFDRKGDEYDPKCADAEWYSLDCGKFTIVRQNQCSVISFCFKSKEPNMFHQIVTWEPTKRLYFQKSEHCWSEGLILMLDWIGPWEQILRHSWTTMLIREQFYLVIFVEKTFLKTFSLQWFALSSVSGWSYIGSVVDCQNTDATKSCWILAFVDVSVFSTQTLPRHIQPLAHPEHGGLFVNDKGNCVIWQMCVGHGISSGRHFSSACDLTTQTNSTNHKTKLIPSDIPTDTTEIWLLRNSITKITREDFAGMALCQYLGLSNNGITNIEDGAFQDMIQLQSMWLDHNKLTSFPKNNPAGIHRMRLNNNQITESRAKDFAGMLGYMGLFLYENEITQIEDRSFKDMPVLEYISFNKNNLTSVPRNLPTTLKVLNSSLIL